MPNVTMSANSKRAALTIAPFTTQPRPLLLCKDDDKNLGFTISSQPRCSFLVLALHPLLPSLCLSLSLPLCISLSAPATVSPNHRNKRLLPNWFVSLSVKPRGDCCPPFTCLYLWKLRPVLIQWYAAFHPHIFDYIIGTEKFHLIRVLEKYVMRLLFKTFQKRILRNEFNLMNLNEGQCTLLCTMNSQLAWAEVMQSSQPTCSEWYLTHLSKKHGGNYREYSFWQGRNAQFHMQNDIKRFIYLFWHCAPFSLASNTRKQ